MVDGEEMARGPKVAGFSFAAVKAGIRGKDRLDVGLIFCDRPAAAAAVYTTNRVQAAPVLLGKERIGSGRAQAVMINSGIANACTGERGMANARRAAALIARELGVAEELVHVSSTGVIGEQLDMDCFERAAPALAASLAEDGLGGVARAIMTTDTVPKTATRRVDMDGAAVTVAGIAKGAGMIMPNMATMLGFILTDAAVEPDVLAVMLRASVGRSFNRITVDGDTSTNDTVMLLASGAAANAPLATTSGAAARALQAALDDVARDLAAQIVADGEGATKFVTVRVEGAVDAAQADTAARTIANSALVKTAFFGQDANWGRIIAALGRSGAVFDAGRVDIFFDDCQLVKNGLWLGAGPEETAAGVLRRKAFRLLVDLKAGPASAEILTCDLSLDYVRINADYRT